MVDDPIDPANPLTHFREASWEEALDVAASGPARDPRPRRRRKALAGFGSAKGSNEEAYLVQKLIRTGFGSNNVDHCTRLCHASSVAALLENIGSGAVTAPFTAAMDADVIIVIGANPTENHPVAATYFKQAAKRGKTLIVMDPRGQALKRHATHMLQFKPGTDVALLNALMHVIVEEGLYDRQYVQAHTEGFEQLRGASAASSRPRRWRRSAASTPTRCAPSRAPSRPPSAAIVFWGMGISQHVHGTDNARCLISLVLMCGQVGRPGTGLHPLRGQNNVQGASDAGLIPMMFPDYGRVGRTPIRARFEELWGTKLDPEPGLTVVEIVHAIHAGEIKGMYIMGENPAMSDPDAHHARAALAKLEHLVVQDLFLTETAMYADVVLPASAWPEKDGTVTNTNRQVQMGRDGAAAAGRGAPGLVDHPGDRAPDRPRLALPASARRLRRDGAGDAVARQHHLGPARSARAAVTYPCDGPDQPGHDIVFGDRFPTGDGRGRFTPADVLPPAELPDADLPDGADHRPPARALAHRRDDAARELSRRARARGGGEPAPARSAAARRRAGRADPGRRPGAARSSSRRAPTARSPRAWCSSRSATPRPPPTC